MLGVIITNKGNGKRLAEVQPDAQMVKRYLTGRVKDVKTEVGTYETETVNRMRLPNVPVTVEVRHLQPGVSFPDPK